MKNYDFQNRLQQSHHLLSKNDEKIILHLSKRISIPLELGITEMASNIGISPSSITRFCKKLGYRNYNEFQALYNQEKKGQTKPSPIIEKILYYYNKIINSSIQLVDEKLLSTFVNRIKKSERILVCAIGSSGLTAQEFAVKLFRMGFNAKSIIDSHVMLMQASLFTKNDLIIILSNSGETLEVVKMAKIAEKHKVPVLSVTHTPESTLAKLSSTVLYVSNIGQIDDEKFANTQLPLLFLVDTLTYALLSDEILFDNYQKTTEALL